MADQQAPGGVGFDGAGVDAGGDTGRAAVLDGRLGSFRWDSHEAVAYEVAMEAIHRALGALGDALESSDVAADAAETARLRGEQRAAVEALNLDPTDTARVRQVTRHFNQLAASLPLPALPGFPALPSV